MTFYKKGDDNMKSVGSNFQDYFLKIAPDLSIFDLVEQYYFNNAETFGQFSPLFSYNENPVTTFTSNFYRAMFFVKGQGDLSFNGLLALSDTDADYVVFPYKDGQVMIGVSDSPLEIKSFDNTDPNNPVLMDLIIGVGF
jgi:hypothetical protein